MATTETTDLIKALRAIRDEAKKNKPNPDKIFALAASAITKHEAAERA